MGRGLITPVVFSFKMSNPASGHAKSDSNGAVRAAARYNRTWVPH